MLSDDEFSPGVPSNSLRKHSYFSVHNRLGKSTRATAFMWEPSYKFENNPVLSCDPQEQAEAELTAHVEDPSHRLVHTKEGCHEPQDPHGPHHLVPGACGFEAVAAFFEPSFSTVGMCHCTLRLQSLVSCFLFWCPTELWKKKRFNLDRRRLGPIFP